MVASVLDLDECACPALDAVDDVRTHCPHRHDVGDGDFPGRSPGPGVEFFLVADDAVDLGHCSETLGLCLRRATGDDDALMRPLALQAADRLPCLPHSFRGYGAGIDDDRVADAARNGLAQDDLRLVGVEPAAECDDVDAHDTPPW